MSLTRSLLRNRHGVWAIAIAAGIFGWVAYLALPVQLFPDTAPPIVNVITLWPGASTDDVAGDLSEPLEEEFASLEGIAKVKSTSQDNLSVVSLEFDYDRDLGMAAVDVQNAISRIRADLPSTIRDPQVVQFSTNDRPIVSVGVTGPSLIDARHLAEDLLAPALQRVSGVAGVDVFGGAEEAVIVELDPLKLTEARLPLQRIVGSIMGQNANMPAGSLARAHTKSMLRLQGRVSSVEALGSLPLVTGPTDRVRVDEVGTVTQSSLDDEATFAIDGERAIAMQVFKTSDANTVDVVHAVMDEVKRLEAEHPGYHLTIGEESGTFAQTSVDNLLSNVWQALALASLIIFLFLGRARTSGVVVLSMPLSYGLTFAGMSLLDIELNMVTLSAIILAVGMVVDASVVVLENITRRHAEGNLSMEDAAAEGTDEVRLPVLAGVATTLVVLVPLTMLEGFIGKTFGPLAQTLLLAFSSSAFVSLIILPVLALWTGGSGRLDRVAAAIASPFAWSMDLLRRFYLLLLRGALRFRLVTVALAVGSMVGGVLLLQNQGMEVLPHMDGGSFLVSLQTAPGSSLSETQAVVDQIERLVLDQPEVTTVQSQVGFEPGMRAMGAGVQGPTQGQISVTLTPRTERVTSIWDVEQRIRDGIAKIPAIHTVTVREVGGTAKATTVAPIIVDVVGPDPLVLDRIGEQVLERLRGVPNVVEPTRSWRIDQPREGVHINTQLVAAAGLAPLSIARELHAGAEGIDAGTLYTDTGLELPILVRQDRGNSRAPEDLLRFPVSLRDGTMVPIRVFADLSTIIGQGLVTRENFDQTLQITAFSEGRALSFVTADVQKSIVGLELPYGYTATLSGENSDLAEAKSSLIGALLVSLIAVYLLLVAQLRSFMHPFTIMMSIPLSISGVGLALWISDKPVSMPVMVGLILLVGTVVNNAILLLEVIRQRRAEGAARTEALHDAVSLRFRPIMMTSMSTVIGMIPLAAEWALGAERFSPLAVAVIGGMSVATLLTMIVIPVLYDLFESIADGLGALARWIGRGGRKAAPTSVLLLLGLGFGLALSPSTARAASPEPVAAHASAPALTLERARALALAHSPGLAALDAQARASEHRVKRAYNSMLPSLSLDASYSRVSHVEPGSVALPFALPGQDEPGEMQLGEAVDDLFNLRVSLTQPVFDGFGRISSYHAAQSGVALVEAQRHLAEADVALQVDEAYWTVLRLRAREEVARGSVKALDERLSLLATLAAAGRARQLDRTQIQTKRGEAEMMVARLVGQRRVAELRLRSLLGLDPDAELSLVESVQSVSASPEAEAAASGAPEIAVRERARSVTELKAKAAKAPLWPQLMLQAGYTLASPNKRYFPVKAEINGSWDVTLALRWRFWDWGMTRHAADEAAQALRVADHQLEEVRERVSLAERSAQIAVETAQAEVGLAEQRLTHAEASLAVARGELELGRITHTDLATELLEVDKARGDLVDARIAVHIAEARLRRVRGAVPRVEAAGSSK